MEIKNPIKYYLAQSVRTNGKWVFIAWISILAFGANISDNQSFTPDCEPVL